MNMIYPNFHISSSQRVSYLEWQLDDNISTFDDRLFAWIPPIAKFSSRVEDETANEDDACHMAATRIGEKFALPTLRQGLPVLKYESYVFKFSWFYPKNVEFSGLGGFKIGFQTQPIKSRTFPFNVVACGACVLEAVELLRCRLPRTT